MTNGYAWRHELIFFSSLFCVAEPADEIDQVMFHWRDESHKDDPKDIPQVNLVSRIGLCLALSDHRLAAISYQMERLLPHSQHRRNICFPQKLQGFQKGRKLHYKSMDN